MAHQAPMFYHPARFKVGACGRRWGKTQGIGLPAVIWGHGPMRQSDGKPVWKGAAYGKRIWWVTKTHGVAADIWRQLRETLAGAWTDKSEVERRIVLPGGGEITVKSGDEPDVLRGAGLDGLVLDEAAFMAEEVWHVLRPALADKQGWCIFISTPNALERPRGDWFEELFNGAASRPGWARWQRPTADNPIIPAAEIEDAQRALPAIVFRQEHLAEFVTLEGARFRRDWFRYWQPVAGGFNLLRPEGPDRASDEAGFRFATVDLAASVKASADYTVIAAWHCTPANDLILLDLDRRRLPGPDQLPALRGMMDRWRLGAAWIERAGYQLAFIQSAVRAGLPAREIAADKDKIARALPLEGRMQAGAVFFPAGAPFLVDLERELLAFTGDATGHDDQVDACAYAANVVIKQAGKPRVLTF